MRVGESTPTATPARPRIALVAIGDELLAGSQVNGNGVVLGQRCGGLGIQVVTHVVVGDDEQEIADAIRLAAAGHSAVVVCGGLGPTQDDVTREGLARAAGVGLERDADIESSLRDRMRGLAGARDVAVSALNWRQADVPVGARTLPNEVGTAPGFALDLYGVPVYALPGVPNEFATMLDQAVLPDLLLRVPDRPAVAQESVRTVGIWESSVAEVMAPEIERTRGTVTVGFLAARGETRVVITAEGANDAEARARLDPVVSFARNAFGASAYDGASLEGDVVRLLRQGNTTVAFAESLTAGLVAARIADVAGASKVLRGGIVAYATDLKSSLLDIPRIKLFTWQAVSAETAEAMATGVVHACSSDYGVALTGVAGPADQDGYPPGTVFIAVKGPRGIGTRQLALPGDRAQVRALAVTNALAMLRLAVRQDLARLGH